MLLGFRAGADSSLGLATDDFAGTRQAWNLPDGTAPIGRVFPSGGIVMSGTAVKQVVDRCARAAGPVLEAGMWPYLSLKLDPTAALAGLLDPHLAAVGQWATGLGVPVYLSIWHEPENDDFGTHDDLGRAETFVRIHTRAYRAVKAVAGDSIRIGPCHLVYKWLPGTAATADGAVAEAWRVPDDARDFVAADSYTSNWSWAGSGTTLASKTDFQRWLHLLAPPPELIVLAERGISRTFLATTATASATSTADGGSGPGGVAAAELAQARVFTADYQYLKRLRAHALLYWNSGGATDTSEYRLGRAGREAFRWAAVDAVTPPAGGGTPVGDRYAEGFADGQAKAYRELREWLDTRT